MIHDSELQALQTNFNKSHVLEVAALAALVQLTTMTFSKVAKENGGDLSCLLDLQQKAIEQYADGKGYAPGAVGAALAHKARAAKTKRYLSTLPDEVRQKAGTRPEQRAACWMRIVLSKAMAA